MMIKTLIIFTFFFSPLFSDEIDLKPIPLIPNDPTELSQELLNKLLPPSTLEEIKEILKERTFPLVEVLLTLSLLLSMPFILKMILKIKSKEQDEKILISKVELLELIEHFTLNPPEGEEAQKRTLKELKFYIKSHLPQKVHSLTLEELKELSLKDPLIPPLIEYLNESEPIQFQDIKVTPLKFSTTLKKLEELTSLLQ